MHKIEWSQPALDDLISAGAYIAKDSPDAAKKMANRVQEAVEYLIDQPSIGRPGRLKNQGVRCHWDSFCGSFLAAGW